MPPPSINYTQSPEKVLDILVNRHLLTPDQAKEALTTATKEGTSLDALLESRKFVREEDLVQAKAELFGLPYVDLFGRIIRADTLNLVPNELAANYGIAAFNRIGAEVSVAMVDPTNFKAQEALEFLARKNNLTIRYHIVSKSGLQYALRQYENLSTEVEEALKSAEADARTHPGRVNLAEEGFEEVIREAPVAKMVSVILRHAVEGKASDVHIEPVGNETRIRYRVDGILHTSLILPRHVHPAIVARIKVLSNLKIDETRLPQDGRYRMVVEGHEVDYRVSTLPLINSEKVVMRILDTSSGVSTLEELGFMGRGLELMKENIRKSHGMLLITGPTGSGKSTTLYGVLNILNRESVNIVTLEDPVEYYLDGINQSQVNAEVGLTFAAGLRSILRQDPDIIMVGEIRDNETAELAIHASLTGHVVLSTLHTNDAFGAIPRLIDMHIEPFLIASSVNVVVAQRLVRRVCPNCKQPYQPPETIQAEVVATFANISPKALPADLLKKPITLWRGQGCVRCENSGYKGRVSIAEVLSVTPELQRIIVDKQGAGDIIDHTKTEFARQGMLTMKQDGIWKALQGITSVEEVFDATRE
jgi:type IV pilus assembly protein PilB